ncbi:MAG: DMT family transporter [Eubacteriaceae bacterium]|nr:DMT family transporter [Eubacteriaceae bacterium]
MKIDLSRKKQAMAGLIFIVVLWGLDFVMLDYILRSVSAPIVTFVRMAVAAVVSTIYVITAEKGWHIKNHTDMFQLILCGALGMGVYYTIESAGISMTSGPVSSLIMSTVPVLGMIADRIIYGRKITAVKVIGIIGSIAGVAMIVLFGSEGVIASLPGILVMIVAALLWTGYIIVITPVTKKCTLAAFLSVAFTSGAAVCAVICLIQSCTTGLMFHPDFKVWLIMIFSSLICILFGEIIYVNVIKTLSITTVTLANDMLPLSTIIFSFLVFGQTMSPLQLAGGLIIIISVCIITVKE